MQIAMVRLDELWFAPTDCGERGGDGQCFHAVIVPRKNSLFCDLFEPNNPNDGAQMKDRPLFTSVPK